MLNIIIEVLEDIQVLQLPTQGYMDKLPQNLIIQKLVPFNSTIQHQNTIFCLDVSTQ